MKKQKTILRSKFWLFLFLYSFTLTNEVPASSLQDRTRSLKEAYELAGNRQYTKAIVYLGDHVTKEPSLTEDYLWLADYFYYAGKYQQGQSFFKKLESASVQNPNPNLALAALYKHENDWENVFKQSKQALEKKSISFQAVALLIESATKLNRTDALVSQLQSLKKVPEQTHLYDLGYTYWRIKIKSFKKAHDTIEAYLQINREDPYARTLLGDIFLQTTDYQKAISHYRFVTETKAEIHSRLLIEVFPKMSQCYFEIGEIDSALNYLNAAAKLSLKYGALVQQSEIALRLHNKLKENTLYEKLEEICHTGISAFKFISKDSDGLDLYLNLAFCRTLVGDFQKAEYYYRLAYQAAKEDVKKKCRISFALGELALQQDNKPEAQILLNRAQDEAERAGNRQLLNQILLAQADLYRASGNRDIAKRKIESVLRYGQRTQQHDLTELGFIELADLFMQPPIDLEKSRYYLAMADALARQTFKLSYSANHRWMQGNIALLQKDIELAETLYSDAIQLGLETGSHLACLAGQAGLIRTYLAANFPELASSRADTALAYLNKYYDFCMQEFGIEYFDLKRDFFEPAIEAYSRIGELEKMYEACDKYKLQKHLQNISPLAQITTNQPFKDIVSEVQKIRNQIKELWGLLWQGKRIDPDFDSKTKNRIRLLHARKDSLLVRFKLENLKTYHLICPTNLSLQDLQIQLNELKSVYIHYFFGSFASYAIVIEPNNIFCKRINLSGSYIENIAKDIAPFFNYGGDNFSSEKEQTEIQFRVDNAAQLHKILIEPIKPWLIGKKSLIISGDGAINNLPFELLVTNQDALIDPLDYINARFLVEEFATSYVPFSTLINTYKQDKKPNKLMLILSAPEIHADKSTDSDSGSNGVNIELESIWQALGRRQIINLEANLASKDEYLKRQAHFQILHLGLPGTLLDKNPLNSFFIFPKQNENRMAVHELFDQKLNAEIAVLSRLERKLDHDKNGTALAAMMHGFNFAGVPSTITSLWSAGDGNRGKIFEEFYSNLRLGTNKAEALQQAKIKYLQDENRNPYYWAYLTLNGRSNAVKFDNNQQYLLVYMTIIGLLLLITLFVRQFHKFLKEEKASS